jgi:hypothetical protein
MIVFYVFIIIIIIFVLALQVATTSFPTIVTYTQ